MEEQDVNNFSQSVIPEFGTSISATLMPGIWQGVNKIVQGQANKAELERKKKQELASIAEELDPAVVWELDQGDLLKFAEEKEAELTDEAVENKYNLDELNYGDFAKKVKDTKKELAIKTKKAEENQKGFQKVQDDYEKQKALGDKAQFDLEHMKAWLDKFKSAKSIEERNAMLRDTENTAYERNYALLDMAKATIVKPDTTTDASGTTRVFVNEEKYANSIFQYISNQDGEGYYNKHKNSGETKEEFAERMANKFVNDDSIVPEQFRVRPPRTSGSGGDKDSDKSIVTKSKDSNPEWDQSVLKNKIMLQEKPKVGVIDVDKKFVKDFVPVYGFYLKKSPTGQGHTVVAKGTGIDKNGTQIDVDVDYGTNEQAFTTEGYPNIFDLFRNVPTSGSKPAASKTTSQKKAPPVNPN